MRDNRGFTGVDVSIAIIIFVLFVPLITTLFYNFGTSSKKIKRESEALRLAVSTIEENKQMEYTQLQNSETTGGEDGEYKIATTVRSYKDDIAQDSNLRDIIKEVTVNVSYWHENQEQSVELKTLVLKNVPGNPDQNGTFRETSTINGGERSALNPTIPAGFKPVDTDTSAWGNETTAPTAESVDAGLVIEDEIGNQFVWIPVDGTTVEYKKHEYVVDSAVDTSSTADTGNGNWKTYQYRNYSDWTDNGVNTDSVEKYGGFYVARYEAGIPSNANFYASNAGDTYYTAITNPSKNIADYVPVSRAGIPCWNYINQENALIAARNMYATRNSVTSSLIDGYAWDTITTWINKEISGIVEDSTDYGNYYNAAFSISNTLYAIHTVDSALTPSSTYSYGAITSPAGSGINRVELSTGVLDMAKIKNIYDIAGNMYEWTTETGYHGTRETGIKYAVIRAGGLNSNGNDIPVSCRHGNVNTTYVSADVSFRVVLYL